MAEPNISHTALAEYVVDANEVLRFKMVESVSDLENGSLEFEPEMCHQIYGDNENIFGYRGLKISLYMSASSLRSYVATEHQDKVDPTKSDGVTADDVITPIVNVLAPGSYTCNKEEFAVSLTSDAEVSFKPMGELVNSFSISAEGRGDRTFEVYLASEATPGLRDFHERLQAWIMFFIDAASFIDIDDDSWRFFLLFEKRVVEGVTRYFTVGYVTVYEYYAYGRETNNKRPRIAQMLVLPPFQRLGLGSRLLDTVYSHYSADRNVVDITVEDPSDNFVRLRDFVDAKNCMKIDAFSQAEVMKGFTEKMAEAAAKELKICKKQARRVYEIVRLHHTSLADQQQYKDYRVDVKRRLNAPYQKEQSQMAKLQKALKPEEFAAAMVNVTNREQRLEILDKQFQELEEHYRSVLEKVAAA
jgi:histone acetyltransferase 1